MRHIESKIIKYGNLEVFRENLYPDWVIGVYNGVFDLIHKMHCDILYKARQKCDFLILGINSTETITKLKGSTRPINSENDRLFVLASLECIDAITVFPTLTAAEFIKKARPNIYFKDSNYDKEKYADEVRAVEESGGKIELLPFVEGYSSSNLIDKIKNL